MSPKLIKNVHFQYISGSKQYNQNPSHRHLRIKKIKKWKKKFSKMPPVSQKSAPKKLIEYTHMFTYMRKTGIMASWSNGYRVWLQARRLGVRTSLKPFFSAKRFLHVIFIFINIKKLQHIYWKNNCNFCIVVRQNGLGLITCKNLFTKKNGFRLVRTPSLRECRQAC